VTEEWVHAPKDGAMRLVQRITKPSKKPASTPPWAFESTCLVTSAFAGGTWRVPAAELSR